MFVLLQHLIVKMHLKMRYHQRNPVHARLYALKYSAAEVDAALRNSSLDLLLEKTCHVKLRHAMYVFFSKQSPFVQQDTDAYSSAPGFILMIIHF
jgi:hypothetical protein